MRTNQQPRQRLRVRKEAVRAAARDKLGATTDYAIAQGLDMHPSTVSLVFQGHNEPSERFIVAALTVLNGKFEDFFFIETAA